MCYKPVGRFPLKVRSISASLLVFLFASVAAAQSAWFELPVPTAAMNPLRVDLATGTSLALARTVRVLHAIPREDEPPPHVVEFERLLTALDTFEQEAQRLGQRGLSLDMSRNSSERDVLQDVLKTLGFRLREQRNAYRVEAERNDDAVAVRKQLASAGIDTTTIEDKLNAGETLVLAPAVTMMPSPLPLDTWASVIFERAMPARSIFSAIAKDRNAALLLVGLQAMTPATRALLNKDRELLRRLYHDNASAVAAFGAVLQVDSAGTLELPGGPDAIPLWEAVASEKVDHVDRFARALFDRDGGRLAFFVDALTHLDGPRLKFALGLWIADRGIRVDRFRALYRAFVDVDPNWSVATHPFARPLYDPAMLVNLVAVEASGAPAPPAYRRLWEKALDGVDLPSPGAREVGDAGQDGLVDAAWLAEHTRHDHFSDRRILSERVAFGQRVFGAAPDSEMEDVLTALRAFGRFPGLMLAIERIGVRSPATFVAVARRARQMEEVSDPALVVPLLAQFQGVLAILGRLARTGAIDVARREALVRSLATLPASEGRYDGAVAGWLSGELLQSLPKPENRDSTFESTLLAALAERGERRTFEWEEASYIVDVAAASLADLTATRAKQGGNSLDDVMSLWSAVRALQHPTLTIEAIKQGAAALRTAGARIKPLRPWPDLGDEDPLNLKKTLDRSVRDLTRITKPQDAEKAPRAVRPLAQLVDALLAETLVAIAYAPWLGNPANLLGPQADVSHRHRFGLKVITGPVVERRAWLRTAPDGSRVAGAGFIGSLLSLDLAHASKRLRRLGTDTVPAAPRLNPNDKEALADTVALLNPRDLATADLLILGQAVARGRTLVRETKEPAQLDALAVRVSMPGIRRQALSWATLTGTEPTERLFSIVELLALGAEGLATPALDVWGTTSEPVSGCFCLRFPSGRQWSALTGRPGTRLLGAAAPDVTLRVVELLAELKVPAALTPEVLGIATQGFIDTAPPLFDDDWVGVVGHTHRLSREMVEDYVAALVASGPIRPNEAGEKAP